MSINEHKCAYKNTIYVKILNRRNEYEYNCKRQGAKVALHSD